jgi:hypothetical protein
MDLIDKWLLGAVAAAVIGYIGLIYGGCALDSRCHLRTCPNHRYTCGVTYEPDSAPARSDSR